MDFVSDTAGRIIVCHKTDSPCNPLCNFYGKTGIVWGHCVVMPKSIMTTMNSKLGHPYDRPTNAVYANGKPYGA